MGDELEVAVMKQTQETLGKVIKRPPLTEKLLKKPPFRFLHDIITNVIKTTGFMKDLYTGDELNPENIKDKEAKISFLQKAIDVVVIVTGDSLTVRPTKVVAGHEADKTNEFLQALAKATKKKEEGREAVQKVKNGLKPPKPTKKRDASRDKTKEASKEIKEKGDAREKTKGKSDDSKVSKKDRTSRDSRKPPSNKDSRSSKDSSKSSSKDKSQTSVRDKERSRSRDTDAVIKNASGDEPKSEDKKSPSRKNSASPGHKAEEQLPDDTQVNNEETAALVNGDVDEGVSLPSDELQTSPQKVSSQGDSPSMTMPGTGRPTTTRPGTGRPSGTRPPSVAAKKPSDTSKHQRRGLKREPSIETMEQDEPPARPMTSMNRLRSARPSSARPPPPVVRSRRPVEEPAGVEPVNSVANVIVENEKDDEDNAFVVEEPSAPILAEDLISTVPTTTTASTDLNVDNGQHGSLVTQILETKKDLEMGSQQTQLKHTEIDKSSMTDASRKKERELVGREIDKMRSSIQTLTRSVNPLGKMIDYLQEDVDSMQKELEMWQRENLQHVQALKREQSNLESSVEPLKAQLHELDQAIEDQLDKISSVKANILRNEEKIQKLLSNSKS